MEHNRTKHSIFVTVGTTLFDPLVEIISSPQLLQTLPPSYTHITVQYGKGQHVPFQQIPSDEGDHDDDHDDDTSPNRRHYHRKGAKTNPPIIICDSYKFKPSLSRDIQNANLVISHAGAGSIMEGLLAHKKLVVVINSRLMHNHQHELADAMADRGYLICLKCPDMLLDEVVWKEIEDFVPKVFPEGDLFSFPRLLDDHLGFTADDRKDD